MRPTNKPYAFYTDNADYETSLIPGKACWIFPDARPARDDLVRIVDESGEDYLYHKSQFVFVDLAKAVAKKILALKNAS